MYIRSSWKKKPKAKIRTNTKNYNSKKEILEIKKKKLKLHTKRPNDILPLKLPHNNQWITGLKKSFKRPGKKRSNYLEEREN